MGTENGNVTQSNSKGDSNNLGSSAKRATSFTNLKYWVCSHAHMLQGDRQADRWIYIFI